MSALQVRLSAVGLFFVMLLLGQEALAQYAPTPKASPRTPVRREALNGKTASAIPPSRTLEGTADFIDAERLKIDDVEMRLYGVVPPQMGASYGPQARAVVDALAQGAVSCRIHDRARDGSYMAVCKNGAGTDFGLELLRRGLAATARGTLQGSDLGPSYLAAEQAAQMQRLGLWSASLPTALSDKAIKEAAAKIDAVKADALAKAEAEAEAKIKEAAAKTEEAQKRIDQAQGTLALPAQALGQTASLLPPAKPEPKVLELGPSAAEVQAALSAPIEVAAVAAAQEVGPRAGWLERYQLLVSGILALATGLVIGGALLLRRALDRKAELRSLAAALRGELMAARSICLARLAKISREPDDKATAWPRLRTLVFQAYVGRLGHLGAELARQISSIYGQASDYAAYYVGAEARSETASKQQALQTLVQHIEEIMPRLTQIERDGTRVAPPKAALAHKSSSLALVRLLKPVAARIEKHLPRLASLPSSVGGGKGGEGKPMAAPITQEQEDSAAARQDADRAVLWEAVAELKTEMTAEHRSPATRIRHRAIADARALAAAREEEAPQEEAPDAPGEDDFAQAQDDFEEEVAVLREEPSAFEAESQEPAVSPFDADDDGTLVLKKDILQNLEAEMARASSSDLGLEEKSALEAATVLVEAKVEAESKIESEVEAPVVSAAAPAALPVQAQEAESKKNSRSLPAGGRRKEKDIKQAARAEAAAFRASVAAKKDPLEIARAAASASAGPAAALAGHEKYEGINFAAPIFERLARIKDMASAQMERLKPEPLDDMLPDYAHLTEDELEALSYAEAYLAACSPSKR